MEAGLLAPLPQLQQRLTDAAPDFLNQLGVNCVQGPSQCSERFRECIRESYLGDSGETPSKYVPIAPGLMDVCRGGFLNGREEG